MTTTKQIAERLRRRREQLGWTQGEFAARLSMTGSNYSRIESANVAISPEVLSKAAVILRVPITYFFNEAEQEAIEDADAAEFYNGLPPDIKPAARAMLRGLYEQHKAAETTIGKKAE